ncbi:restriction endonuclease subunit S [Lactobacillus equicursoris]|uniref:restriction endonuclease subunit S n=1 Tax=Lactobacillus equicursoris TaxID=420645 RepID=UPI002431AB13|nr:restriction endonuclease subunit S [Lactobacillus equicursoris]MDD6387138.1 restriction endonuclease subunit S [Lactobacillus equicursoris]
MTKRDAKDEKKAPKLRFKGFTDDWEHGQVKDIAKRITRKNKNNESNLPLTISAQDGLMAQENFFDKQVASKDLSNYLLLYKGDFAYNKSYSNGYPYGAVKRLEHYDSGVVSSLYITFKPITVDSDFLAEYYEATNWHKEIYKRAAEGARNHGLLNITANDFFEGSIVYPKNLSEQKRIGSLFQNLDRTITLHEEKQKQLEQLKKGLSQKLFADKIGFPEIRFKGFGVPWEQCKFGNLFKFLQNNTLSRASLNNENGYGQNVHYGDVLIKYHEILDTSKIRLDYIPSKDTVDKYKKSFLENGDIIIADTAEDETVGKCTEILGLTKQKVISGLHTIPVRPKRKFAPGYLGFYLNSNAYHNQLRPLMQGIKVTSISKSSIKNTKVMYPVDLDEQDKISKMLINMDSLISANQQKIDQLKSLKQALLQQMFI